MIVKDKREETERNQKTRNLPWPLGSTSGIDDGKKQFKKGKENFIFCVWFLEVLGGSESDSHG